MITEHELFGELHEQEENGLIGNEHKRQHEARQEALRLSDVVGRSEQLKALLCKVVDEFDSGEVTWDTRDEIESVLKSL